VSPRKKIPTKAELIQLQKIYKTDEKIGEYLGGVPAYLVAYWRRKKNVPRHSVPKFSEKEIRDLWERFGDDDKCGLELGISKAAFYNWRRRYGIKEKPAFLKLEQLEFDFPGVKSMQPIDTLYGKQTIVQKIMTRVASREKVEVGETVEVEPDLVVTHDPFGEIIQKFKSLNTEYVWNPNKVIITLSGCTGPRPEGPPVAYKTIREFARRQAVRAFYDIRDGFSNQVVIEKGLVMPGQLIVGNERYSPSFGCLNTYTGQVDNDRMASLLVTGKVQLEVPATVRVEINGRRSRGVYTKDIALSVIKQLAGEGVAGKTVEFCGSVVSRMNTNERFTLINMAMDLNTRGAVIPFDSITRRYLTGRTGSNYLPMISDKNAVYDGLYQINIDQLAPQIICPDGIDNVKAVAELEGLPVEQIIIGTCVNGRFDDLRVAAEILKGKHIHDDCRLIVIPASRAIFLEALKKGIIRVLVEAGAIVMNPGCSFCLDAKTDLYNSGKPTLATANSGFLNRTGKAKADIYICSPATAAASALNASITDPSRFVK